MAIPARSIDDSPSLLHLDSYDHVLEDLVESMANMEVAIGVRRTIVEHKWLFIASLICLPFVEFVGTLAKMLLKKLGVRASTGDRVS